MVTRTEATPGYLPGIEAGLWQVVLGLHQLPAEGLQVEVEVLIPATRPVEAEPPAPPATSGSRGSGRAPDAPAGMTWFAGDFHAHTCHSDGTLSTAPLAAVGTARGLDFLAVTDHNTTSHFAGLPAVAAQYDLTLIPGQEITTHRGHANAFGDIAWVDFRNPAEAWVERVEREGGLLSINHPLQDDCAWQHELVRLPRAFEFWHISWFLDQTATGPWALLDGWQRRAVAESGRPAALIGGSDFHFPEQGFPPGTPTTWVLSEDRSIEATLAAVEAGRTAISRFPGPGEPLLLRMDDGLLALDADGAVLVDREGRRKVLHGDRIVLPLKNDVMRLEAADRSLLAVC